MDCETALRALLNDAQFDYKDDKTRAAIANASAALKSPTLKTRLTRVNDALHALGLVYHETLSYVLNEVDRALVTQGFSEVEPEPIYSGLGGKIHMEVGDGKWLSLSWHRMGSGRYEVTAYVN